MKKFEKKPLLSFDEIVSDIVSVLHEKDIKYLLSLPKTDLYSLHSTWGMHIRNFYGLWDDKNPLTLLNYAPVLVDGNEHAKSVNEDFPGIDIAIAASSPFQVDISPKHPDHVSQKVMECVWEKIRETPEKVYA